MKLLTRGKCKILLSKIKSKKKWAFLLIISICIVAIDYLGISTHFWEENFDTSFTYPYEGDVTQFVNEMRLGLSPLAAPINVYNYSFLSSVKHNCEGKEIRLVILVKSAAANFDRRLAIRNSWGFERQFSDVEIRTVFFVGNVDFYVLLSLLREKEMYNDIVHINFFDTYFNNTIKTMSAIRWAVEYCATSKFYLFSDDDIYISAKNVLRFLRNPLYYPNHFDTAVQQVFDTELPSDVVLYAGDVVFSAPHRHKSSKWYISLWEYPYNRWPPFITGGTFILSREALYRMYYTSMYTKHFRFDDIFLSLVALKAKIKPFHCDYFYVYHMPRTLESYENVIAAHGFDNPQILLRTWNEQKASGFA